MIRVLVWSVTSLMLYERLCKFFALQFLSGLLSEPGEILLSVILIINTNQRLTMLMFFLTTLISIPQIVGDVVSGEDIATSERSNFTKQKNQSNSIGYNLIVDCCNVDLLIQLLIL